MAHLAPGTFVDLLDGIVAETSVPHLGDCTVCRQQLAELRATWRAATEADMPEPSPLFWDHLSARVRDAVAAEREVRAPWWRVGWSWNVAGALGAAAAAVLLVVVVQPGRTVAPVTTPSTAASSAVVEPSSVALLPPLPPLADDESIGFVADLASNLEWDEVASLGIGPQGGADVAVADMNDDERLELQRLLTDALGPERSSQL